MTHENYLQKFKEITDEMYALTARKNADYASTTDAWANFTLIEKLTAGQIRAEEGILVRITDKLQRVANLLNREGQVKDEKITDTLMDAAVYSIILLIYLNELSTGDLYTVRDESIIKK